MFIKYTKIALLLGLLLHSTQVLSDPLLGSLPGSDYSHEEWISNVSTWTDLNGDGFAEIAVGYPNYVDNGGVNVGKIVVYSGADLSNLYNLYGSSLFPRLGETVKVIGDVNGDGIIDLIGGTSKKDGVGFHYDFVRIFSGAGASIVYSIQETLGSFGHYSASVDSVGDINGDSKDEFLVGAYGMGLYDQGRAFLYSGVDGQLLKQHNGGVSNLTEDRAFGISTLGIGDINLDGINDYLVSATYGPSIYGDPILRGSVTAFSGSDYNQIYEVYGAYASEYMGYKLFSLDDVNGDTVNDFLASSRLGFSVIRSGIDGSVIRLVQSDIAVSISDRTGDNKRDILILTQSGTDVTLSIENSVTAQIAASTILNVGTTPSDFSIFDGGVSDDGKSRILLNVISGSSRTLYVFGPSASSGGGGPSATPSPSPSPSPGPSVSPTPVVSPNPTPGMTSQDLADISFILSARDEAIAFLSKGVSKLGKRKKISKKIAQKLQEAVDRIGVSSLAVSSQYNLSSFIKAKNLATTLSKATKVPSNKSWNKLKNYLVDLG